jgi:hypothetical protein
MLQTTDAGFALHRSRIVDPGARLLVSHPRPPMPGGEQQDARLGARHGASLPRAIARLIAPNPGALPLGSSSRAPAERPRCRS